MSIQVASKPFVPAKIPITNINHSLYIWLYIQFLYFKERIIKKQYFFACKIIPVKFIIGDFHPHMKIGLFGFSVTLFSIKAKIFYSFADSQTFSKIKKLRKNSFTPKRFGYKNRTYPPDLLILVGQEHSSNRLVINFLNESLPIIRFDQIFYCFCDKIRIKFFVFSLFGHSNHKLSH